MATPNTEQLVALRDLYRRMKALGVSDDGYPDTRKNGDVFITFRIGQLIPLIEQAENNKEDKNND